jgi:hypothetical protein
VHESAHLIAARALGVPGGGAWIAIAGDGVVGRATTAHVSGLAGIWARAGKYRRPTSPIIAKIIICCAGAEAERCLYGFCRWDDFDRESITYLLTLLPERLRREDRLRAFARALVHRHRVAIALVALGLAERLELSADEVDEWIEQPIQALAKLKAHRENLGRI